MGPCHFLGVNGENKMAADFGGIEIVRKSDDNVARRECTKPEEQARKNGVTLKSVPLGNDGWCVCGSTCLKHE